MTALYVVVAIAMFAIGPALWYREHRRKERYREWVAEVLEAEDYFNRGMPAHGRACLRRAAAMDYRRKGKP